MSLATRHKSADGKIDIKKVGLFSAIAAAIVVVIVLVSLIAGGTISIPGLDGSSQTSKMTTEKANEAIYVHWSPYGFYGHGGYLSDYHSPTSSYVTVDSTFEAAVDQKALGLLADDYWAGIGMAPSVAIVFENADLGIGVSTSTTGVVFFCVSWMDGAMYYIFAVDAADFNAVAAAARGFKVIYV